MEMIMMSINESWIWLGPLLVICFGTALIAEVVDLFTAASGSYEPTARREDAESAEDFYYD